VSLASHCSITHMVSADDTAATCENSQNWGKGREIIDQQRIHRSVLNRLSYEMGQKDAKTTMIQDVVAEVKKTFLSKKQKRKLELEKEVELPKASFADGRSWEDVLNLDPEDDIWERVIPVN
jgi:hypothetical protein